MAEHESVEALQFEKQKQNGQEQEDEEYEEEGDEDENDDEEEKQRSEFQPGESQSSAPESRDTQLETLAVPPMVELTENDQYAGFGVNSALPSIDGAQFQGQGKNVY